MQSSWQGVCWAGGAGRVPAEEAPPWRTRIEIHHTPKHGSWFTVAEIELAVLERQRQRVGDRAALEREATAWATRRNAAAATVAWQFTTADARTKPGRPYPAIEP